MLDMFNSRYGNDTELVQELLRERRSTDREQCAAATDNIEYVHGLYHGPHEHAEFSCNDVQFAGSHKLRQ